MPIFPTNPLVWVDVSPTPNQKFWISVYKTYLNKKTEFQDVWLLECGDYGKSLFLDGESQSAVNNEFYYHEALVHPTCALHGAPKNVLILGGGEGATSREVLKWVTVEKIVMVDIDKELVELCKAYLPEMHQDAFDDPRLKVLFQDAVQYLEDERFEWDIIISDLTSPTEDGNSYKLFTPQYLQLCQKNLKPDGLFVIQAGPVVPVNMSMHTKLANTVSTVFPCIRSYATLEGWGFVIGSKKEIDFNLASLHFDEVLLKNTTGRFRTIDGVSIVGMLNTPKYLRDAIKAETTIFQNHQ
jgi:spermidine synthase